MFDELIDTVSTVFTIIIVIFVAYIAVVIIKSIISHIESAERNQKKQQKQQELINQILSDSKSLPTEVLVAQRDDVLQAYNELYDCRQRGSIKTEEILPFFRVGDNLGCSMDLRTCCAVLEILNSEIQKRKQ